MLDRNPHEELPHPQSRDPLETGDAFRSNKSRPGELDYRTTDELADADTGGNNWISREDVVDPSAEGAIIDGAHAAVTGAQTQDPENPKGLPLEEQEGVEPVEFDLDAYVADLAARNPGASQGDHTDLAERQLRAEKRFGHLANERDALGEKLSPVSIPRNEINPADQGTKYEQRPNNNWKTMKRKMRDREDPRFDRDSRRAS